MADKPFLTIQEQIARLEERGLTTDEHTAETLMREGYYSIVNGYKEPFIDPVATNAADDDRYIKGSSFEDMRALFEFDRNLRELTFHYLIRAEATIRTAIAYCFSKEHRSHEAYLDQSSYCTKGEYALCGKPADDYFDELSKLIGLLRGRARNSPSDFIVHYRENYGSVPLWVLCNDLAFGNLEHFFNLMKPVEKENVCRMIATSTGRLGDKQLGYFKVEKANVAIEAMVKFRNICAHDERLYCARVGGMKDINYAKLVWFLERFLTRDEFIEFLSRLLDLLLDGIHENPAIEKVLDPLGYSELAQELSNRTNAAPSGDGGM